MTTEAERLAEFCEASSLPMAAALLRSQAAEIERLNGLTETLRQEAVIHAQEARTANATIAEIYKLCTGATGEPGNWNGANPVREAFDKANTLLRQALEALEYVVEQGGGPVCEHEAGGAVCFCKENAAIAAIKTHLGEQT